MKEGDVVLAALPQADGQLKPRPIVILRQMPPFGDWLVCGVSTQLHQLVAGLDETIEPAHGDFMGSGLKAASLAESLPASQPSIKAIIHAMADGVKRQRR